MAILHDAARVGDVQQVRELIEAGADVNARTTMEEPLPLIFALSSRRDDHKGPFCNCTPLHYACHYGHKEVAEMLIRAGADVNAVGGYRNDPINTPLFCANRKHNVQVMRTLLDHGAVIHNEAEIRRIWMEYDTNHEDDFPAMFDMSTLYMLLDAGAPESKHPLLRELQRTRRELLEYRQLPRNIEEAIVRLANVARA